MRGSIGFWDARFMAIALVETGYLDEAQGVLRRIDARDPRLSWLRNDPLLLPRPSVIRRPRRAG
jgi:hypothetical protein